MLTADAAIQRLRRDLTLSALTRYGLFIGACAALLLGPFIDSRFNGSLALALIGGRG